jgi:beta-phosphoglucomutase-like phosphatase (HAD superfamily)
MKYLEAPTGAVIDLDETLLDNRDPTTGENAHTIAVVDAVHVVTGGLSRYLQQVSVAEAHAISQQVPTHSIEAGLEQLFLNGGLDDHPEKANLINEILERKDLNYIEFLKDTAQPIPGAIEFYRRLAEKYKLHGRMALQSGARRIDAKIFLDKVGMLDLIPPERMFTRESIRYSKPDPEVNERAFLALGLPEADRSGVIGFDDDFRGITSIRKAGLYAVGVTTVHSISEFEASSCPPDLAGDYRTLSSFFGVAA